MHRNGGSLFKFVPMNWYCLYTRPKKEARVAEHCQSVLGLDTYFPRVREQRVIRRVKRIVEGPLFPRYVFCRFETARSYRAVRFAPDVLDLVHAGKKPAVVDCRLIDELQSWAGDSLDLVNLQPALQAGETVEITTGPMRGLKATILRAADDRERVAILLSMLQYEAQLLVSRSDLRRVS